MLKFMVTAVWNYNNTLMVPLIFSILFSNTNSSIKLRVMLLSILLSYFLPQLFDK
jgi:hypothetical protein